MTEKITNLVRKCRDSEKHFGMSNVPIYETSTIVFPTVDDYFNARKGSSIYYPDRKEDFDFAYGTVGSPTSFALSDMIAELEGVEYCMVTPSGLASIANALFGLLSNGDHLIVVDCVYGPTRRFCNQELKRAGVEYDFISPSESVEKYIKKNTKVIFLESPGSLLMEMQDIGEITKIAKEKNIYTIMDCSWATPIYFDPFKHGVDVSLHALSKYVSGNSDIIIGTISAKEKFIFDKIYNSRHNFGAIPSPYDCSLALRGIRSLEVRLQRHYENTLKLIKWLKSQKKIAKIFYPADEEFEGYGLWKKYFTGASGLFSFGIKDTNFGKVKNFINDLKLFSIGASWGGTESIVMPFDISELRTASEFDKDLFYVRISTGLENVDDLISDIDKSLRLL